MPILEVISFTKSEMPACLNFFTKFLIGSKSISEMSTSGNMLGSSTNLLAKIGGTENDLAFRECVTVRKMWNGIALLRAITEVSQTRAANIQGARDDLRKIKYSDENTDDRRAWQFMPSTKKIKFSEVQTFLNGDILDDINLILLRLRSVGLNQVIIVNLTNPDIGVPVVRAIVPGLETFKITKSVMGIRAKAYFKQWSSR